jgi:hypothetical protein
VWSYAGSPKDRFYSSHIAGSERLPNGNTLVCVGEIGRVFEVTPDDKIVWDYHSPFSGEVPESLFPWMPVVREAFRQEEHQFSLARALRVAASHPGLAQLASAAVK